MGERRHLVAIGVVASVFAANACFTFGDLSGDDASSVRDGGGDATTDGANANDGQASTLDSGAGDSGARFCATVTPPPGSADFFCADFDGVSAGENLPDGGVSISDGGQLSLTTTVAVSAPNALLASVAGSTYPVSQAYLEWQKAGAKQLDSVLVDVSINPRALDGMVTQVGGTYLIVLKQANTTVYYEYSNGEATGDADVYVGYIVTIEQVSGDEVFVDTFQVPTLPTELWTDVALGFNLATGAFVLKYDGNVVATAAQQMATDTTADVIIGAQNEGQSSGGNWRFDNVTIATTRAP